MTTTAHVDLHDWRTFGAELNVVSFEELYRAHVESGFLYASKQARLASLWHRMRTTASGWCCCRWLIGCFPSRDPEHHADKDDRPAASSGSKPAPVS